MNPRAASHIKTSHPTGRAGHCVAIRKLLGAALAPLAACLLCLANLPAHANGRLPGATGLAIHPTQGDELLLGLTYGLALSRDGGASWSWMCEQQIEGNGSDVDPAIVMTDDGTLIVLSLTNGGVLVSTDDGCTFQRAMGPLAGHRGVDLTLDTSQSGRVLALLSTIIEAAIGGHPRLRNLVAQSLDHGRTWTILAELPDDMWGETLEVAPSDPERIYVSGTSSADPLLGIVERSDDGGVTWTRTTVDLPHGSGSLFVSGIHPTDRERLWFRVPGRGDIYGVLPARLWLSTDGAASFEPVGDTQGGMLGFAVSPEGDRVVFGGPLDGLFVAPSDASTAPTKIANVQVKCLRWHANGLYVCADEPTAPYSLGYTTEPTEGIAPLWNRRDTCRATCPPASPLEVTCREPWKVIAPLVNASAPICGAPSSIPDAGTGGGLSIDAGSTSLAKGPDGGPDAITAVTSGPRSPAQATAPKTSSTGGCTVSSSLARAPRTPWWLALMLILAVRRHRALARIPRRSHT